MFPYPETFGFYTITMEVNLRSISSDRTMKSLSPNAMIDPNDETKTAEATPVEPETPQEPKSEPQKIEVEPA